MATQQNFDFDSFNALTDRIPAGLQVFLAQQLLSNALWQMEKFDNPRAETVRGIFGEVKALRVLLKQDAADRAVRG